jgi:hypothetical protein
MIEEIQYDWNGNDWSLYSRRQYVYDPFAFQVEYIYQHWINGSWVNDFRTLYSYNENDSLKVELEQDWISGKWINTHMHELTYDDENRIIESKYCDWTGLSWENDYRYIYLFEFEENKSESYNQHWIDGAWSNRICFIEYYDSVGNVLNRIMQRDDHNGSLENFSRGQYIYDENNNCIELYGYDWADTIWAYDQYSQYTYDSNGNRIESLLQRWRNEQWEGSQKYIFAYDENGNQTESLLQFHYISGWENNRRTLYSYNNQNKLIESLSQFWRDEAWDNNARSQYTFDENGNQIEYLNQDWENDAWLNDIKRTSEYQAIELAPAISTVYPGDTNNDGIVDELDILPIGVYFLEEGASRIETSMKWEGQDVSTWRSYPANYADCNGDGVIDEKDIIPIGVNWGSFRSNSIEKHMIDPDNHQILTQHKEAFETIYHAVEGLESQPAMAIKQLLETSLGIVPKTAVLYPCYPNPFNPSTSIKFSLPDVMEVSIKIYDINGKLVANLIDNVSFVPGYHNVDFNAINYSSGIYIYVLETENSLHTNKMILIK